MNTLPITDPGTGIHKLSVATYDRLDRVRSTQLKTLINASPKHLKHEQDAEDEGPDSEAFEVGNALHCLLLEPERYPTEVVVFRDGASRKSAAYDRCRDRNQGKTILLEKEVPQVKSMVSAVRADPAASKYLAQGEPEVTALWTDEQTGIECRARFDWLDECDKQNPIIVEIKSARDAGEDKFSRQADDLLYTLSWAQYRAGYMAVRGVAPELVTIVVEKTEPFDVVVYRIGEVTLLAGESLFRQALDTLKECRATGKWLGKGRGEVRELQLKKWARGMPRDVGLDWS